MFSFLFAQIVKNLPTMQDTRVQSLGWEDPLEDGMALPLPYSCLGNPTDTGAWWAIVYGVAKSWTRLSDYTLLSTLGLENIELRPGGLQDGDHCR